MYLSVTLFGLLTITPAVNEPFPWPSMVALIFLALVGESGAVEMSVCQTSPDGIRTPKKCPARRVPLARKIRLPGWLSGQKRCGWIAVAVARGKSKSQ